MPRQRSPERDRAFEIYRDCAGNISNREIAKSLGIPEKSVGGWKAKDRWIDKLNGILPKKERSIPKPKKRHAEKDGNVGVRSEDPDRGPLSERQALFVEHYLIDFNATRAAIEAGYSKRSAYSIGWENLRKPEIQDEIKSRTDAMLSGLGITQQRVILEYLRIAFADITDYVSFGQRDEPVVGMYGPVKDENGNILIKRANYVALKQSDEIDGSLVQEVKQGRDGVSIKLHDKVRALDVLTKYLDLLPDRHKRRIEEERLKIEQARLELDRKKVDGTGDDGDSDDGFLEALKGRASEIWDDDQRDSEAND